MMVTEILLEYAGVFERNSQITLWLFNIAMDNGPFTDDFPSYKPPFTMDCPWLC